MGGTPRFPGGPVRFCVIGRGGHGFPFLRGKSARVQRVDSTCLASGKILIIAQPSPTDGDVHASRQKSVLGDFSLKSRRTTEDAMRRAICRGARQLPRGGPTLIALLLSLSSLNLVINYEREIIINICRAGDRPTLNAHFLWQDLD